MGLSLLNPYFLLLAAILPILALAYRNQEKRTIRKVTSLLIFKTLPKRTLSLKRFKPPFRFFVELLSLLLLILAAAGLTVKLTSERKLLLIDNSLSMSAIGLGMAGPESRIDEAKRKTKEDISEGLSSYDVYVTSPVLTKVDNISSIQTAKSTDDLETRLFEAIAKFGYKQGVVISDRRAEHELAGFRSITVGTAAENIYIAGFQWLGGDQGVRLKIGHSGPSNVLTRVTVGATSSNVYLNGDTSKEVDFKLSLKNGDPIKVTVEAVSGSVKEDAVKGDNQLDLIFRSGSEKKVLVVADDPDFKTHSKLTNIPNWNFTFVTPAEFDALSADKKSQSSFFLFYKTAPKVAPTTSSLFILPPADNVVLPVKTDSTDSQVTSWQDNHPLNLYLRLSLFKFPAVKIFEESAAVLPIVNVSGGPIVAVKDQGDIRYAGVGFEIFPFEGRSDPLLSVFTLNLFNWFSGSRPEEQPMTSESTTFPESFYNPVELPTDIIVKPTQEEPALRWLVYLTLGLLSLEVLISVGRRWV